MGASKVLLLLSLVAATGAGPIILQESEKCSTHCQQSSKFKYNPDTTYIYDYRVDTDSSIVGAFEDSAKTTLQTSVNIEVLSQCEFGLQLKNTRLFHTDDKGSLKTADRDSEFRSEVERSPLRFSFQNGIVDHVCPDKDESVRSLNLKKGILSAFQNSMDDLTQNQNMSETDVTGVCKTEYKMVSSGYYTTEVKKVKEILTCSDRLDYRTMLQLTPYKVPSDFQNLPLMKTTHECEQAVQNGGVLKSAICKESHVYRPFANGATGATTTVKQTLTYQTYRSGVNIRDGALKTKSSLIFDHSDDQPNKEQARNTVEQLLGEICETTRFDVRSETPRLFSELVAAMKGLDKQEMTDLHRLLKTKTMCPTNGKTYKYFHDAIPMISNSASVSLMAELITTKDATGLEAIAWLTSLAFIQNPTTDMLLDIKTLIDNKDVREDAMLPVSSMVNNFCKNMGTCNQEYAVLSLMSSLERNIDYNCDASGKKFELTLLTLKALGNAGHPIRTIPVLNKCLTSTYNPLEIRVAAAEAFRRMPCSVDEQNLWDTFADKDLDSELRINAYLGLMRCPSEATLRKIAVILSAEEDEQVGAFVYSHLTNLRETSDPHKQGVAEVINNLILVKEFDLSPVKYSRNFEVSGLLNKINTGVTAEGNLIWSNKVQLPRAVSGNLTVQLFGQSINLLDFGGRMEGLEYLIKNIFGPYVNSEEKDSWSKIDADNMKGSIYGRVFGNEMLFMHSQATKSLFGKKPPTYLDLLIKMANKQHISLTQSVQFLDVSMVIPTSAGFPIHVCVNGTATIDLKMSGKMDLRKVGSAPRSMNVDGEIRPSAALEITGTMTVDSFVTKTGVRMRNTLHTSTVVKGRIQLNRGQKLNVELDTPEDKMEIFDARSKFFILHDDKEIEQKMIEENRKDFKYCSSEQMTKITGMEICGQLSFPNASMKADSPYYPLTGPSAVSVTLFKRDSHSGYKLFVKRVENKISSIAQVSINTPGSQTNRAIFVDMSINYKKQNVEMKMVSPWKKIAIDGNMINLKDLKSLSGKFVVDDKDTYAMTGDVKVTQSKTRIQLNPMIEFRRPGADNVQVTGLIAMEQPMKVFNMEMSLSGINKLPYTVKTVVTNTKKEKSLQASISLDGKNEYSIRASNVMNIMGKKSVIAVIENQLEVQSLERTFATISSTANYKEGKSLEWDSSIYIYRVLKKPATLKVNLFKIARKRAVNYKAIVNMKSSYLTGAIRCNVVKKPNGLISVESKIDYTVPKVAKNMINLSGKFNNRSTKSLKFYSIKSSIKIKNHPEYNHNMKADIAHKKKLSYVTMDMKYGANPKDETKKLHLYTSLNRKDATMKIANINYKFKAEAPAHKVDVLLECKHQHSPKLLDTNVQLSYSPKKDIIAALTLRDRSTKLSKMNGKATVSWPGKEYTINTDLTQKSAKQYAHTLNFKSNAGTRHTISTNYKMPKSNSHDIVTSFRLHKLKPVTISGTTNLNLKNFAASGEVKTGKDVYGFNTMCKISKASSGKFGLELIHPERRFTLVVNGGKSRSKYEGMIETDWDAGKNQSSKMSLGGGFFHKVAKGSVSAGGNVNFNSPFENFENLLGSVKYGSDPSQHTASGKFLWGDKKTHISSTLSMKKPISLSNLHLDGSIKTPFKGIRNAAIEVTHKFDNGLSTVIKGDIEKESAKLSVQGKATKNGFKGDMNLKSTIKNAESVIVSAFHATEGDSCTSNAEVNHNGKVYAYDLTMSHSGDGWQRNTDGNLVLKLNKQKIATQWNHKNTDATIRSKLSSKWDDKRVLFDLNGSHKLSDLRNINGVLKIKSPWKPARDIEFNVDHKHGSDLINSVAFLRQGSNKKASSVINYNLGENNIDFDFDITSPFHEQLNGKLNANYDSYPLTTTAELKWAPKKKATVEGSITVPSWDDADFSLKMTTPSRTLRNVVLKASNKRQKGELLSHLNLYYGMRQNIDIESRIGNEEKSKMFRLKLKSPYEQLRSLNTGLTFNGHAYKFDANADFEVLPTIKKFDGAVNWEFEPKKKNIVYGKMRLDTPLVNYPYFELSSSSVRTGDLRKSHIQVEYGPHKVFGLDSTYTCLKCHPMSFDAVVKSPYAEFNDIGLSFQHDMGASSIKSQAEIKYQSGKKIEGDFNADWTSNIDGSLIVKTPFRGYESNKISMRHRGELANFDSHGEINVAEADIVADASFKSGVTTTATFTFTSPITGLKNIDASLRKRGKLSNMKSGCIIKINGEKIQATFNNRLTKDSLKTNLNVITPFTKAFKFGLDHSGLPESFNNKISINYGRKVGIDTIASFDIRDNNVKGNGVVKYNLGNGRKTARVSISKSGPVEDISLTTVVAFQKDEISVSASLNTKDGIDGSVHIKTPFDDFKNTGMSMSHSGHISDFTTSTNINYMDNKNINGKLEFSHGNGIKLSSELTTPFKNFESTTVKFYHDISAYSGDVSGIAELETTIGEFGNGDIVYSKTGDMNDLVLKGSMSASGKNLALLKLTNKMDESELHSMCSFKSVKTPDVYLSIDHTGDHFTFNTNTMARVGKNMISTDASMKQTYDSFIADSSLTYQIEGQNKNVASISLKNGGDWYDWNVDLAGRFNDEEVKLFATRTGPLESFQFGASASYNGDSIDVNGIWKNTENIEGTLKLITPFDNFKNLGIVLSHKGELSAFSSNFNLNYMDGKNILGKVELNAYSMESIQFVCDLQTPFEHFETLSMKFNNNYDQYTSELRGNAAIDTSIAGFGTGSIVYNKVGSLKDLTLIGTVLRNGVEVDDLKITNSHQAQELHSSIEYKSIRTNHIFLTLDHSGDLSNMKTSARASFGKKNVINGEASLTQVGNTIDAEGKLFYNIENFQNHQASLSFHKEGELNDFNVVFTGKHAGDVSKITCNFKNQDELTGDLTVNTPIDRYRNIGLSFQHSGNLDRFNCEGKLMLIDNNEFSGKIEFYRSLFQTIETVIELNTPITDYEFNKFEYRHEGHSDKFTCNSALQYGKSQRITYDLSATSSPSPQITVTLKMPENQVIATGSYENTWPKYAINAKLDAGVEKTIVLDGSFDASKDIDGVLTLSTPVDGFTNVGLNFKHSPKHNGLSAEGKVTYMDGKDISGKVEAKMNKNIREFSVEVATPFKNFEFAKYEAKHISNKKVNKVTTTVIYLDNEKMTVEAYRKFKPSPEISIFVDIPLIFKNTFEAFVSIPENNWPKYEITSRLNPGNGKQYTMDAAFDATKDISGSVKIHTPITDFNRIGMSFIHSGDNEKFGTEGALTYKDEQEIFGKINFYRYMWRRIDASIELTTPFISMQNTKAEVNFEDNSNSISTTAALEYNNGQKLNGNVKITYSPDYDVLITLNTPFNDFSVIKAEGALDLTAPAYEAMCSLNYGSDKVYSANGKFNLYSAERMDGTLEVNTPLEGFEYTKAEYEHKVDSSELEGSVTFTYYDGKKMSCDIKSTLSPNFDGTVTVKTPFRGFEYMQASSTFESSYNRYETSSSLNFGQGNLYTMSSELDYSIEPMKASTKVSTPFEDFRNVEFSMTHVGGLTNFRSTGFLSSPLTNHVNAAASLRYDAVLDMAATASLQSSLEGFDDLKAGIQTSDVAGEVKTYAIVGWTGSQQMTYEGQFLKQKVWNEDKMHADVSISTPFVAVRTLNLQMDYSAQTDSFAQKMNFVMNDDNLLDFDAEYNFNYMMSGEVIVRQPWPMQYSAKKSSNDGITDAEVFVNWNRDEPESNVRVQATVTDKSDSYQTENSVDLSIAYASRKVGVVHKLSEKSFQLLSNGYIYWNSDNESKVSYDLQLNDNSRRRKQMLDGSFKLGLPSRTLGLTGSYSNNAATTITDTTFSWDADHDDSKQIGVKATINQGDNLKGTVAVSMPSMRKEISISGEVMVNQGRVILDTKTDISYSRDSTKTLTLTSKLEDISTRNSHFNYSLVLGMKHPHTNIDIQLNSHVGSSDEAMTLGMETSYMTSKRQMKNLALLSEINMLKKQINVQLTNPMNKIEVIGDMISENPQKFRLLNKIDGVEAFRSDMTIDRKKKAFSFNTFTEADTLSFSAKYPNTSAFKMELTHHNPNFDHDEALLFVRLNTSRFLHTRLSWRPEMMEEFSDYILPKALEKTASAVLVITSTNDAVAEELSSKYAAITNEISKEMHPFINALNEELIVVAEKMNELSAELKEMYERNDYYIQNMGERVLKLQEKMQRLSNKYKTSYSEMIRSLIKSLREMRNYPIAANYRDFVTENGKWLITESVKSLSSLQSYMAEVDQALKEYKTSMMELKQKALDKIYNTSYVDYLSNHIMQVPDIEISPYISSFPLHEQYTNVINEVPAKISAKLSDIFDNSEAKFVKEGLNEVYQQGVWVYNYWEIEKNLEKHAESILETLKKIVEEELKEYSEDLKMLVRNPITVWDPEHGEIQAGIPMPFDIKRLDKMPDITPIINKAEQFAVTYLPNQGTWNNLVESMSDLWPITITSNNTYEKNLVVELSQYQPTKKLKKHRKRIYKLTKAMNYQ